MTMRADVLLVSMPFGLLHRPSIGLSLLAGALAGRGIHADVAYYTLRFAERVGDREYARIADGEPANWTFAGEWIFAPQLFERLRPEREYLQEILVDSLAGRGDHAPASPELQRQVSRMRAGAGGFLDECAADVAARQPRIVGFTSTFQQHVASLALARRIKAGSPQTLIVLGGANCEGVMGAETLRQFPFVDAVVSGEGDLAFPELVQRVLAGRSAGGIPGVYVREDLAGRFEQGRFESAARVQDMDQLPYVDYDDYFAQYASSARRFDARRTPDVLFETSRGCWWGERQHCTFCGLNGSGMAFRRKSARRALDELNHLAGRYPDCTVDVVDNILSMDYFQELIPALAKGPRELHLFYETKANLTKAQLGLLRRAGIRSIQPGVESLSDPVLKLMRKGVSAVQNIQLLKWCAELGIQPYWNLIWGFPGEPEQEYSRMAALVPLLTHLPPPYKFGPIRLDRFSPNYDQSKQFGFCDVEPFPAYRHIYPLPDPAVENLAYYFTYRYATPRDVDGYTRPLAGALAEWKRVHEHSALFCDRRGDELHLWDLRNGGSHRVVLRGVEAALYIRCDRARGIRALRKVAAAAAGQVVPDPEITAALRGLCDQGVMIEQGGVYLSLAIPLGTYTPGPEVMGRLFELNIAPRLSRAGDQGRP